MARKNLSKSNGSIHAGACGMSELPIDELTERVIGCAIAVHTTPSDRVRRKAGRETEPVHPLAAAR
jgi:hypothetical protein